MNLHFEKVFTILLSKEQFITLLKQFPQAVFKKQVNTYYDTADMYIRQHIGAMRIREFDNRFIFTLKQRCADKDGVNEHECFVSENTPAVFESEQVQTLMKSFKITQPIIEIASLTTYRATVPLDYAELCLDYNEYNGICDYELEYEYLQEHDGLTVFNKILSLVNLKYESNCMSKIQRAMINRENG